MSAARHRHDGTSPLPLGLDASAAPDIWSGETTVWPHDPKGGWSYCVMVSGWTMLPLTKSTNGAAMNPVVFYQVHVGIQSPLGLSSLHRILRRFSDFVKLHSALRRLFPRKVLPTPPPKHALQRMNTKQALDERKLLLAEWMEQLLEDLDVSRSAAMATFLELEAAAREAVIASESADCTTPPSPSLSSNPIPPPGDPSSPPPPSSVSQWQPSASLAPSESSLGSFMEPTKPAQEDKRETEPPRAEEWEGSDSGSFRSDATATRQDSQGSGTFPGLGLGLGSGLGSGLEGVEARLPVDARWRVGQALSALRARVAGARDDVEAAGARLAQESAVREFLALKVKELESELDGERRKSRDAASAAAMADREAATEAQWEAEEAKAMAYEAVEARREVEAERDALARQLDDAEALIGSLRADAAEAEELQGQAKADVRRLAREVKGLRSAVAELEGRAREAEAGRAAAQKMVDEVHNAEEQRAYLQTKLLREVSALRQRLSECSLEALLKEDSGSHGFQLPEAVEKINSRASPEDMVEMLGTLDARIGLLLAEAKILVSPKEFDDGLTLSAGNSINSGGNAENVASALGKSGGSDAFVWQAMTDVLTDNGQLRKAMNSLVRQAIFMAEQSEKSKHSS